MHRLLAKFLIPLMIFAAVGIWFFPHKSDEVLGCTNDASGKNVTGYDPTSTVGEFEGKLVSVPPVDTQTVAQVLGDASDKRIEVDLGAQHVYAYEGSNRVFDFIVSTGKWALTPTGTFTIRVKVPAQKMSGGSKELGTYYYLPNVPWVMFFGNENIPASRGFSFHGTYWHNNFGQPMSHGCINMKIPDAGALYDWAPQGTKVVIY